MQPVSALGRMRDRGGDEGLDERETGRHAAILKCARVFCICSNVTGLFPRAVKSYRSLRDRRLLFESVQFSLSARQAAAGGRKYRPRGAVLLPAAGAN